MPRIPACMGTMARALSGARQGGGKAFSLSEIWRVQQPAHRSRAFVLEHNGRLDLDLEALVLGQRGCEMGQLLACLDNGLELLPVWHMARRRAVIAAAAA